MFDTSMLQPLNQNGLNGPTGMSQNALQAPQLQLQMPTAYPQPRMPFLGGLAYRPGAAPPSTAAPPPGIGPGGLPTTQLQVGPSGSTIGRPSAYGSAPGAGFGSTYGGPMGPIAYPRMPLAGGIPADQPQPGPFPATPAPRIPTLTPPWRSRLAVG